MTTLLGQVSLDGTAVPERSRSLFAGDGGTLLARAPLLERVDGTTVAIAGNPRLAEVRGGSLAARLVAAWRDRGPAVLEDLRGPFALVLADPERRRALLAIDRMGIERLTWGRAGGYCAFGSSASEVARLLSESPGLEKQALFNFMLNHMVPAPATAFTGVRKLLPAGAVEIEGSSIREFRYWDPDFSRSQGASAGTLEDALLPALRNAVEVRQGEATTGSFLSGGLDSSTVTGLFSEIRSRDADAFSVGFGVPEFNELPYARIAARHFGCRHHEYEVTADDVARLVPEIAAAYDEPFGNSSAVPTLACVEFAQGHGMTHLLAGDGGDELFGGNERYVTQRVFELYSRIPAPLRRSVLDRLAGLFHPEDSLLPLRKFASYVQQANIPLPERYESWNLVYREGPARIFAPEFLAQVDTQSPLTHMHDVWRSCPADDLLDRMLWYDWKFILADNDLRKVKQMCDLRGMQVTFPMLDETIVDLSLQVPSDAKIDGKVLRAFYKNATSSLLPAEIIRKKKHGFGLPFGHWLKEHAGLQDLAYGSLDSLEQRGIFRPDFLHKVASEHKQGHPGYYGYAIWDLMMLEQWLQAQERNGVATNL